MANEIERKFLVLNESFKELAFAKEEISQGYLSDIPERIVRVRILGSKGYITVKTRNVGFLRSEWEYEIPADEAREMLEEAAIRVLSKTRYFFHATDGLVWEIDCFHGHLEGLIIAEVELDKEDSAFVIPSFVGVEVTGDPRYYNSNLAIQV